MWQLQQASRCVAALPAPTCSDGLKDLISRILVRDPALRPTLHVSTC